MESNMGTGLVLSMFGTVTDEDLKDHQSSSKGNLAKSQRFKEEESELFVQYFHLIRRALFTMQNAKANSKQRLIVKSPLMVSKSGPARPSG